MQPLNLIKPWINPLQRWHWLCLAKPLAGSCGASHMPAEAPTCTISHAGQHHPLPRKTSFSFKAHTGTYALLCCQHMPVLRNVKSTNTNSIKHEAFAPPWIRAFHMLCPLWRMSCCENFGKSFVKTKRMTGF